MEISEIVENTGHDAKGTGGFEYQFLYFVDRLLKMTEKGDAVSYEKYDDVSKERHGELTYFQLKHTIGGTKEKPVNLQLRDHDLWKTISVWIDIANKQDKTKLEDFLQQNKFVLVTNKVTKDNPFWEKLQEYQEGALIFDALKFFYEDIYNKTRDSKQEEVKLPKESQTQKYIKSLIDFKYSELLLKSMEFCYEPDLKENILYSLEHSKYVPRHNLIPTYNELLGAIHDKLQDGKNSYTIEEFARLFGGIFNKYKNRKFNGVRNTMELPSTDKLQEQVFIKQLLDVEDITKDDIDEIADYTMMKLDFINNVREAIHDNIYSEDEVKTNTNDSVRFWKDKYKYHMKRVNADDRDDILKRAARLLNDIRSKRVSLDEEELDDYFSNGCFYYLSDKDEEHEPQIGWRPGWKEKYKGDG